MDWFCGYAYLSPGSSANPLVSVCVSLENRTNSMGEGISCREFITQMMKERAQRESRGGRGHPETSHGRKLHPGAGDDVCQEQSPVAWLPARFQIRGKGSLLRALGPLGLLKTGGQCWW